MWKFNVGIAIKVNNFYKKNEIKKIWKNSHVSSSSSIDGGPAIHPFGGSPPYACAKAFKYVRQNIRKRINKFNIHVSAILPGPILTENKHWDKLKKIRNFLKSLSKNLCRLVKCLKSKKSFQL